MSQVPTTKGVNFTGTWELRTTDNLDEFLESEGVGWIKRKAAKALGATNNIDHNVEKNEMTLKITNLVGTCQYTFTIDGKEYEFQDGQKAKIKATAKWNDDKTVLTEERSMEKDKKRTLERYIKGEEMLLKITNEKGKSMLRYFKKTKNESGL